MTSVIVYSEKERNDLEKFIEEKIGHIEKVFHEKYSEYVHTDIAVISPDEETPYYKLVTMGMGARTMNAPKKCNDRIELLMFLEADWNLETDGMEGLWPIELLRKLSKIPFSANTYFGDGHSLNNRGPICDYTDYSAMIFLKGISKSEFLPPVKFSFFKKAEFLVVYPIYAEEYEKKTNDVYDLLDVIKDEDFPLTKINRKNYGVK